MALEVTGRWMPWVGLWVIFFYLGDSPWQALRRVINGRPYADREEAGWTSTI